ncbi:MAG TPA: tRNA-dihydrouridine synthase, partial [Terriglobales bacterium]|nr:tRNA-dihydrouridine synthase [Terriglobales bacterium]
MKYWYKDKGSAGTPAREKPDPAPTADGIAPEASTRPFPATLQIGQVQIRPATVLAPMAGVTDTVFRRFIKNLGGCGLIMTEFTSADGVLRSKKTAGRYLHFYDDEHP